MIIQNFHKKMKIYNIQNLYKNREIKYLKSFRAKINVRRKSMDIIFLTSYYSPYIMGGAEISNEILINGISKKNKVKVLTFGKENKTYVYKNLIVKKIYINNIIKKHLKNYEKNKNDNKIQKIIKYFYRIETYINRLKYERIVIRELKVCKKEIFHSSGINLYFPQFWWKIANKNKIKVIHTLRDPVLIYSRAVPAKNILGKFFDYFHKKFFIKYVEKYVDYIHAPTQYMIDLHTKNGFKFKNTKVIPNTVEIDFKQANFQNKIYDLVFVGTLAENKGIKTLIRLKENNPCLSMIFVGEGPLSEDAKKNGIKVTGWLTQNEVFKWIEKSKVLILPSEWEEAFGRVLIEAIALGTISIGSNRGGIPEVLFNDSKYIFEAKNIKELNQKIRRVLSLNEIDYRIELLKLQEKMQIYKYENHIKQFEEFYDEVSKDRR